MLSRKLPPGAAQAVDLASDPGPAQPSNRPVAYSREHLQLLPQTELVNLVLMWQSFHRMLPAPPHAVLQARAGPLGGQQPAQAPDAGTQHVEPQIQVPPFAAAQMKGLAPGAAYIGGVGGVKRGLNGVPAAADGRPRKRSDSGARHGPAAPGAQQKEAEAAEQMTMLSPTLAPASAGPVAAAAWSAAAGGVAAPTAQTASFPASEGGAAGPVPVASPVSPARLTALPPALPPSALGSPSSSAAKMPVPPPTSSASKKPRSASNFPGRLPASGSLADPRAQGQPKVALTQFSSDGSLGPLSAAQGPSGRPPNGADHNLVPSSSTERLEDRLNRPALGIFPMVQSRSEEGLDTLRLVASGSLDQLRPLQSSDSLAELAGRDSEAKALNPLRESESLSSLPSTDGIRWHHQIPDSAEDAGWRPPVGEAPSEAEGKGAVRTGLS